MLKATVSKNINAARVGAGLSQRHLATQIGVCFNQVCRWENGRSSPEYEMVEEIAKFFKKPAAWFFEDHDTGTDGVVIPITWARKLRMVYQGLAAVSPGMEPLPRELTECEETDDCEINFCELPSLRTSQESAAFVLAGQKHHVRATLIQPDGAPPRHPNLYKLA